MDGGRRALIGGALALAAQGLSPRAARASDPTPPPPPDVAPPDPRAALDPLAMRILANQVTRMSAEVRLGDGRPHAFVIDTGAERSTLATELAVELGLAAGPNVLVHGVTGPEITPSARLPLLEVAGERFANLVLPVAPRARLGADGLLGLDALGGFRLTFDMGRGQVRLSRPSDDVGIFTRGGHSDWSTGSRLSQRNALATRRRGGQLTIVGVQADAVRIEAFVDSGAQYTVGNPALFEALALRRPTLRERRVQTPLVGVNGQTIMGELATVERLKIGSAVLTDLPVVFADLHAFRVMNLAEMPALLLGADLIGAFDRVTLDFAGNEVRFARLRRRPETLAPRG